jgi:hypothetical protein
MTQLLLSPSQEHGFFIWHGYGRAYQASLQPETKWTLVESTRPAMGALLLETLATVDETLAADEVLARGESGRAGWCTPELLRISGRRLLRPGGTNRDKAEVLMLRSIDTARRQGALSWELRAAISLAQLWQTQDRNSQASDLLASTLNRFTKDLQPPTSSEPPISWRTCMLQPEGDTAESEPLAENRKCADSAQHSGSRIFRRKVAIARATPGPGRSVSIKMRSGARQRPCA